MSRRATDGTLSAVSSIIDLTAGDEAFDAAAETLEKGSVVVLPVGGVYAVVADAFNTAATQRIFAARRKSRLTPLPVLIRSERQVSGLAGEVPEYADRLMAAYWPGALTLILPASEGMTWDLGKSLGTVQLRRPGDDLVLRLIGKVGPLVGTAANRLDQPRPVTVEEAKQQLGVLVPLYLDGGQTDGTVSTIVDATGPGAVVHREGVIATEDVMVVAQGEVAWGERPPPRARSTSPVDERQPAPPDQTDQSSETEEA